MPGPNLVERRKSAAHSSYDAIESCVRPKLYDQLNKHTYPTVIFMKGGWAEVWCAVCGVNTHEAVNEPRGDFNGGMNGLHGHFIRKHTVDPKAYRWEKWTYKAIADFCETYGGCRYISKEDEERIRDGKTPKVQITKHNQPSQVPQQQDHSTMIQDTPAHSLYGVYSHSNLPADNVAGGIQQGRASMSKRTFSEASTSHGSHGGEQTPTNLPYRSTDGNSDNQIETMPKAEVNGSSWKRHGDDIEVLDVTSRTRKAPRPDSSSFHPPSWGMEKTFPVDGRDGRS